MAPDGPNLAGAKSIWTGSPASCCFNSVHREETNAAIGPVHYTLQTICRLSSVLCDVNRGQRARESYAESPVIRAIVSC